MTRPAAPLRYVRFQGSAPGPRGAPVGVFGLVNTLAKQGILTTEEEWFRRETNAWYDAAYTNPATVDPTVYDLVLHPGAAAWFKTTATHLTDPVEGYLAILDAHGVGWVRLESDHPGQVIYEDDDQVVVTPETATESVTSSGPVHRWHIEPREYARQEQRRGRRHAYEHLDPARTALVVVDMVPFFADANPYFRGIVPNINHLASALRQTGGHIAWVVPGSREPGPASVEFLGPDVADTFAKCGGDGPVPGRLWSGLDAEDGELFVEKTATSAFFPGRCQLPDLLAERGVDTVLVAGTVTNVCCESSARDAATLGFRVVMVADANAAMRDADHNAALHTIYRTFGDVRPTTEVTELLRNGVAGAVARRPVPARP